MEAALSGQKSLRLPYVDILLPNDRYERDRLNLHHEIIKQAFGRILFPPIRLGGNDRVLDCGTGSGAWVTNVANNVPPTVHLYGIDIDPFSFPERHPPNAHFLVQSTLDMPAEWSNTFTLANQRMLVSAFSQKDWHRSAQETFRVLKPGGYVQLLELDARLHQVLALGPRSRRLEEVANAIWHERGMLTDPASVLPDVLTECGFENVVIETRDVPVNRRSGAMGALHLYNISQAYREMGEAIVRAGGYGIVSSLREFTDLVVAAREEWAENEAAVATFVMVYGRKPLLTLESG
ncbi:S-adenosyl-L-methionine-dependent methyltransferase [Coniophora puteana RWD-64-598 SS2]|uniref:S-adenosyl-L-methionine-dependent methyltransferase n=1 Tax=Coniophora puteana (strain RWD-64-598) TaxID=741705 RepID=A0A5M3M756_CONPW|nr:S-adenosyl-L-methionine-dependent methyltransferase [Coniophora puteana RWD-64-598 SS2]EIW74917.1 S-adenosyl-L-methionine-dependent methyltransferase [Coniophora puteana RWD-64-598 SS2]